MARDLRGYAQDRGLVHLHGLALNWTAAIGAGLSVEGGPALASVRGAADWFALSAFGTLVFLAVVASAPLRRLGERAVERKLERLASACVAMAGLLTLAWAALEAVQLGGSPSELPGVLAATWFGHLVLTRLALLLFAEVALALRATRVAAILAGVAVGTQAGHGHAMAMYDGPSWLLLSGTVHVLAAGAWLGGLLPLALVIAAAPPEIAALASRRFSPLGTACVLLIAASAAFQSTALIGSVARVIGTAYGLVALLKAVLLLLLLGFAARNRFRLTPALDRPGPAKAKLVRSILGETVVGLLTVLAAGLLTSLAPAMHRQPVWPFGAQLSLEAVSEEPEFLQEVSFAAAAILAAAVLMAAALVRRRARWAASALAALVVWRAAPHLGLLLAPAHPTQFWTSPTGFAATSITEGQALYPKYCAMCHGQQGRGDGPAGGSLPVPPADLTAGHLWAHPDGELFWWLSQGIEGPSGRSVMPGFAAVLTVDQRWALIDWIWANNAGLARRADGRWPQPVKAPGLTLTCSDPSRTELADLRGTVVLVGFGGRLSVPAAVTVLVDSDATPDAQACVARDRSTAVAYAAVTGLTPQALRHVVVLVDGNGWLRAVLPRQPASDRAAANGLAREVQLIIAAPLTLPSHSHPGMRM